MSFAKMEQPDLYRLATEEFGVEVAPTAGVDEISAALVEKGVTWDMAVQFDAVAADIDRAEKAENGDTSEKPKRGRPAKAENKEPEKSTDLLRMLRENRRYEVRGYKFTKEDPFALVDSDTAAWIVENVEGFRYATPKEAKEYYG